MASEKPSPPNERSIAILAVTAHGVELALHIQAGIEGSLCYAPRRHRFAVSMGAVPFDRLAAVFPEVWRKHSALVCIMATGIVVRLIAPRVHHKAEDPAVVVVDERGNFVISLLSGHLGGANELARRVAALTGGQAVITTATDVRKKPALDCIAQQKELAIENLEMLPRVARAILEDEAIRLHDPDNWLSPELDDIQAIRRKRDETEDPGCSEVPKVGVWVSETGPPPGVEWLILRPRNLVVGVGCNRGTPASEILELIHLVFRDEGLSLTSIRDLASVDLKADEGGLLEAARQIARPITFFSRSELREVQVPNPSAQVEEHIGVSSVCEAAAMRSAANGRLLVTKRKTPNVTVAVARVAYPS